jgi:hypothetical protein
VLVDRGYWGQDMPIGGLSVFVARLRIRRNTQKPWQENARGGAPYNHRVSKESLVDVYRYLDYCAFLRDLAISPLQATRAIELIRIQLNTLPRLGA